MGGDASGGQDKHLGLYLLLFSIADAKGVGADEGSPPIDEIHTVAGELVLQHRYLSLQDMFHSEDQVLGGDGTLHPVAYAVEAPLSETRQVKYGLS